jgi:Uncharacterized protein with SCP/PR1 domains
MKLKTVLKNGSKGVALVFTCSLLGMSMTTLAQEAVELISSAETSVESEVLEESTEMEMNSESVAPREAVLEVESATQEATEEVSQEEAVTETEIHSEVVERQEMSEDRNLREPLINWDFPGIEAYPSIDAPANINPAQARINSLTSLSFDGTDKYSYSWRVLELINIERAKAGLDILVMDEDLLEVAMKRGHEAAFSYSHIRPDGTLFWTAEQSTSIAQENIAIWYSTPEQAMYIWMNSPAYRADFLSDAYKSVGVGCFQMGEAYYWVLLFSQDESAITASKKIDQRVTATIAALTNTIHARINMTISNVKEGHRITSSFLVYRTNSDYGVPIKLSEVDWASSNQGVGVIDSNGTIKGVKSGLMTITGALKSNPSLFATREISVIPLTAVEQFVARFYTHILEREFDESGLAYWTNLLTSGKITAADMGQAMLLSPEFRAKTVSDTAYLEILYKVFMNRTPSGGEVSYWRNYLVSGASRKAILARFLGSEEFTNISRQYGVSRGSITLTENREINLNLTAYIYRCYHEILGRNADIEGLNYWTGLIISQKMTANQVTQSFLSSSEYRNKNTTNLAYLDTLYRTYMGRQGDTEGLRYWENQLKSGVSRQIVAKRFGNSAEFRQILKSYGL